MNQATQPQDDDADEWISLMMCRDAAKTSPALWDEFEKRLPAAVVKAADECTSYGDFKRLLLEYTAECDIIAMDGQAALLNEV